MGDKHRILIAGGGTGGHLFPAMAIGEELRRRGAEILYMGSKFGIEADHLLAKGEAPVLLNIRGLQRGFDRTSVKRNIAFPFRFAAAYLKARKSITAFDPHVVVGTGGYSSGLPLLAAVRMGKRTLIHEQNSYPGMTTRKLSGSVDRVCLGFAQASAYCKKKTGFIRGIQ